MDAHRQAFAWYVGRDGSENPPGLCPTRDIFQAHLDGFYAGLMRKRSDSPDAALLVSVIGEIGNNCFDHNLGFWQDQPGCVFAYTFHASCVWVSVADAGRGVLASLKRVQPGLRNDQEALDVAFSQIVSGRHPEKRGNGLKYVRAVINGSSGKGVLFLSGTGRVAFGSEDCLEGVDRPDSGVGKPGQGAFAFVTWRLA